MYFTQLIQFNSLQFCIISVFTDWVFRRRKNDMYQNPLYLIVAFSFFTSYATGLYFHLAEGERKCFIEEVPSDTMVTSKIVNSNLIYSKIADLLCLYVISAHYKIELYDSRSGGFAPPSLGKWKVSHMKRMIHKSILEIAILIITMKMNLSIFNRYRNACWSKRSRR